MIARRGGLVLTSTGFPRARVDPDGLDAVQLAAAWRAGIYRLFEQTDHLNKINVFPVPDGDTGTNLSMTLSAVLAAIERDPLQHAGALLVRIADAALDGARGNSGSILAQFLLGLADTAGQQPRLTAAQFAAAAATGAAYARDALSEPREGTLLTMLRDFADELQACRRADPLIGFRPAFAAAMTRVRASLAATTDQIEELRNARVVDAGALGFVELLTGMQQYLDTGEQGLSSAALVHRPDAEPMADSAFVETLPQLRPDLARYCTECLVVAAEGAPDLELRSLREGLSGLGTSLVVGGSKRKARLHIHTDDPERVFGFAAGFGAVTGQKADDMQRQQNAAHHAKARRVAVVIDSAADIPEALLDALGIHVVPVRIHFGNRSYLDKVSLTPAEFYRELRTSPDHPKTSQPPPGDFRRMYEFLASHYESIVSIALSAKVSGTCNAALTAAGRVAPRADGTRVVTVLDSLSVSAGQGLVAIIAAERARDGASAGEVLAAAQEAVRHTRAFALLGSVDYAVRGGRVPGFARTLVNLFHVSLILATRADGSVGLGGALWGRRDRMRRFARFVARQLPEAPARDSSRSTGRLRILIGHGDAPAQAQELAAQLAALVPDGAIDRPLVTEMGTALGVHGGPGTLVVGLCRDGG